jgi:hypothetical protein
MDARTPRKPDIMAAPRYKRILLKLSGEALQGQQGYGIDAGVLETIADGIRDAAGLGVEVAVVIGGGNIFRGLSAAASGMDRASADYMGMLATVMNSLALQDALEQRGVYTRVMSAIEMKEVAEPGPWFLDLCRLREYDGPGGSMIIRPWVYEGPGRGFRFGPNV